MEFGHNGFRFMLCAQRNQTAEQTFIDAFTLETTNLLSSTQPYTYIDLSRSFACFAVVAPVDMTSVRCEGPYV